MAIKFATKTRALVLAQNLNVLAEKKAQIEQEKEREQQENEYKSASASYGGGYFSSVTRKESSSHDSDDIIIESSVPKSTFKSTSLATQENNHHPTSTYETTQASDVSTCITPTTMATNMTRLNPFAKNAFSATKTPLNDSSKSVINEIEEKLIRQQSATKEKDTWKPTPPTKKLTKNKVTDSGSINSFFGASPTIPKN